ncbi:MAG: hypothetical protein AAFR33_05140 [Pseudomonadota bacterium]
MSRLLLIAILLVNLVDIIIHVAADRIEPVRITSNVIVIAGAILALVPSLRGLARPAILLAGLCYVALNGWFVATQGIGGVGIVLIAATVLLSLAFIVTGRGTRD